MTFIELRRHTRESAVAFGRRRRRAAETTLRVLAIRSRRALEIGRLEARPGLRRELLTIDYVLPFARRRSQPSPLRLRTRSKWAAGTLYFGRESFSVDRVAYFGIFLEGWYRANYRGATVVDVGAHKGYYAAFALLEGAAEVRSYEPESANFALLERAAATYDRPWLVTRAAVGSSSGEAKLHVSAESAGHSLFLEQRAGSRRTLGSESVAVVAMNDVLNEASCAGNPVIVKIDAEGSECEIVLGTPVDAWRGVDLVFLEVHHFAPCSTSEIVEHLRSSGLEVHLHTVDDDADLVGLRRAPRRPARRGRALR